jgi:hypothetical protein
LSQKRPTKGQYTFFIYRSPPSFRSHPIHHPIRLSHFRFNPPLNLQRQPFRRPINTNANSRRPCVQHFLLFRIKNKSSKFGLFHLDWAW